MYLEEKKMLIPRRNLLQQWNDKEWWYTGVYDSDLNIYLGFSFARVNVTDHFSIVLFDGNKSNTVSFEKNLFLDSYQEKDRLCLNYHSKNLDIEYNGDEKNGWKFKFRSKDFSVNLDIKPTIPYFTKFDNNFKYKYNLLHFFHNDVTGIIETKQGTYHIKQGLGYYDHCFGTVPGRTGWHWIAVQNKDTALATLVNYGAYPQRYTQIFSKNNNKGIGLNKWIRLEQEVSFEYDPQRKFDSDWKVTSKDMELVVTQLGHACKMTKIPSILPIFINLVHYEFFVKVSGRVFVEGEWIEINDLYGTMEEHYGRW
ncbi:MAG: DUF2804 family protein [Clostridia bacterium]|nr:DUF2804 family protein [Clostridia bacterium]